MNIVLSGPSGSGKGTLTEKLMQERGYKKFVTVTTRKPRDGERNGFDYIFLSNDKFEEYNKLGILHNIKEYDGNYYASFESDMDNIISDTPMIFQLTPDRALEMKRRNPDTILILILPPNAYELNTRRGKRSTKRVEDDIRNLEIARSFDCVVVNDNLNVAFTELLTVIDNFNNDLVEKNKLTINYKITDMIEQLKQTNLSSKVEKVFSKNVADMWDDKSRFVTYHGVKNPITSEVLNNSCDGMKIADIGCGTGKLLSKIDQKIRGANLIGLDISDDMVSHAQTRIYTSNNKMEFINRDFLQYNFGTQFDLIIFSYVLHHMDDPKEALQKARKMLSENGKILFSVPGDNYLTETFLKNELDGRFSLQQMDEIVSQAGLYPLSACRNDFLMTFNSYEMYLKYLKSIGTYQKVSGYSDKSWSDEFDKSIMERYNSSSYITGEYLTYNCVDKAKILRR